MSVDDRESTLRKLNSHRNLLRIAEEKAAEFGHLYVPGYLQMEIERERAEIAELEARLQQFDRAGAESTHDEARADYVAAALQRYQAAMSYQIDPAALAAAYDALGMIPLERIPGPAVLPAGSRMPLIPNPLFTGRDRELRSLARLFKGNSPTDLGQVAVISGMGGVGKTQLAAEFAHRYGQYFAGGVFWLSCSDPALMPTEIAACGEGYGVMISGSERANPTDQIAVVAASWKSALPRLLVFDNCEDVEILRTWRPPTGGCRILVTSQHAQWKTDLGVHEIALPVLDPDDSVALLARRNLDLSAEPALAAIAEELGHLPLALHLAGTFLADYRARISPADYLADLRAAVLDHPSLTTARHSPTNHERDVARTMAFSYDRLDPASPVDAHARSILLHLAFLKPGELVPRALLDAIPGPDAGQRRYLDEDALRRLRDLGLVELAADGMVRAHRLVVAFIRSIADPAAMQPAVEKLLIAAISQPVEDDDTVAVAPLVSHMTYVTDSALQRADGQAATLGNIAAESLLLMGNYSQARSYAEQSFTICQKVFNADSLEVAQSMYVFANVLNDLGEYPQAQQLFEQALHIRESVLGSNHIETAYSLNNLATLFIRLGSYEAARPLLERSLAIREANHGLDDPKTTLSLNNLAVLFIKLGNYGSARLLLERVLATREATLGPNHPNTAISLSNLASLLSSIGNYAAAQPLLERALTIREATFGPNHPETAASLNNLGSLFSTIGDYAIARPLLEQALAIREVALGPNHPEIADSLNDLGGLFSTIGDYAIAQPLLERALSIREVALGPNHRDIAATLSHLGGLFNKMGKNDAAQPLLERALVIREAVLGPTHPDTANSLNNLGMILYKLSDFNAAKPLLERALSIYDHIFGKLYHEGFYPLVNLGHIHFMRGHILQSRKYFTRALDTASHNPSLKDVSIQQMKRQLAQIGGPFRTKPQQKPKRKK
ncbi:MAG TPA: tetratricopeptide repeat protein [Herpetosiphonaceae bacterium]|nr:tetratricopeptide repeat protein [Herpetosiphonaceae bacterium]